MFVLILRRTLAAGYGIQWGLVTLIRIFVNDVYKQVFNMGITYTANAILVSTHLEYKCPNTHPNEVISWNKQYVVCQVWERQIPFSACSYHPLRHYIKTEEITVYHGPFRNILVAEVCTRTGNTLSFHKIILTRYRCCFLSRKPIIAWYSEQKWAHKQRTVFKTPLYT